MEHLNSKLQQFVIAIRNGLSKEEVASIGTKIEEATFDIQKRLPNGGITSNFCAIIRMNVDTIVRIYGEIKIAKLIRDKVFPNQIQVCLIRIDKAHKNLAKSLEIELKEVNFALKESIS